MTDIPLRVKHIYEHDPQTFETSVQTALDELLSAGAQVGDIKYVNDPSTAENKRGGFGALIIYEVPVDE